MIRKKLGLLTAFFLIITSCSVIGNSNIDVDNLECENSNSYKNADIGFIFVIGDFTETETHYSGHYSYYLFIEIISGEFHFYQGQDEYLMLPKEAIVRGYILTSTIIFARILTIL